VLGGGVAAAVVVVVAEVPRLERVDRQTAASAPGGARRDDPGDLLAELGVPVTADKRMLRRSCVRGLRRTACSSGHPAARRTVASSSRHGPDDESAGDPPPSLGKGGRDIRVEDALDHIFGYAVGLT